MPDQAEFATKPTLAGQMIAAALDAGTSTTWVTGEEAYGQDPGLRPLLESRETGYVLAVACSTRVRINQGRTAARADAMANRLPTSAWHRQNAGSGAKGPRYDDWAWIEIGADGHRDLLIRRNPNSGELAFYLCWAPKPVPLSELIRVAGTRWCIEECVQAAKGQVGLDHHQVRYWTAWHRHITLAMLAIDLTVPEIRHLLGALLNPPSTSPRRLLHWSNWRRRHQATARRSHYQRRLASPSTA